MNITAQTPHSYAAARRNVVDRFLAALRSVSHASGTMLWLRACVTLP